jgi:uracil-DNA glycosylase
MNADDRREMWESLGVVEDWLRGGLRGPRVPEPDFDAAGEAEAGAGDLASAGAYGGGDSLEAAARDSLEAIARDSLEAIAAEIEKCRACRLCEKRRRAVPGLGSARPLALIVGEGPGAEEDARGEPFVGPAGQLLDRMLASIGLGRGTNCFITNIVKCRPPQNRDPAPDEQAACLGYLRRQIALLRPKAILCVGRIAAQALLGTADGVGKLRGRWREFEGLPLLVTYHPSALLRDESYKRPAWEDLKLFRERASPEA